MAFDTSITSYFPNATVDSQGIFLSYDDLESFKLSTNDDIRQLVYSFNKAVANVYEDLPFADRSNLMTVSSSKGFLDNDSVRSNFSLSFNLDFTGTYSVEPEPTETPSVSP